jgi:hypothetical protein
MTSRSRTPPASCRLALALCVLLRLTVPTLVIGCQRDVVAPVSARAIPMYESILAPVSRAYPELARAPY